MSDRPSDGPPGPAPDEADRATADSRAIDEDWPERLRRLQQTYGNGAEEALDEACSRLEETVEGLGDSGYTSVVLGRRRLILYWCGSVPAEVQAVVEAARRGGVAVDVRDAPHSLRVMMQAVESISHDADIHGVRLSMIAIHDEGTGVTVGAPNKQLDAVRALESVQECVVPVTVLHQPPVDPL